MKLSKQEQTLRNISLQNYITIIGSPIWL